jgi:hypothetical protein
MTLEAWMEKHAKNDVWVAAQTGFDRVTISRTRRGKTKPSWALAAKLKALTNGEVTADDYLPPVKERPMQARVARC